MAHAQYPSYTPSEAVGHLTAKVLTSFELFMAAVQMAEMCKVQGQECGIGHGQSPGLSAQQRAQGCAPGTVV